MDRESGRPRQRSRSRNSGTVFLTKIAVSALVMAVMCFIGLLWFLRPKTSMVEKRELTAFPRFTLASFWDGSFFSGVDTWYADTYPLRESLIRADQSLESRYGIRGTQIVGTPMQADAIPVAGAGGTTAAGTPAADMGGAPAAADPGPAAPTPTPEPTPTPLPDGTVHELGEFQNSIYITGGAAYGMYGFSQNGADAYISTMNQIYKNVGDKVNLYVMNVPISASVMLDEHVWADMGCSDEGAAIDYIVAGLDPGIHALDVYDTLREHNAEYIYFRTDHHWTQLGAYYAYRVFCGEKGLTPHELSQFKTGEFGAGQYLGSYYTESGKPPQLASNPDTVQAWYPMCVNAEDPNARDMHMVQRDGSEYDWRIINDMFDYPDSEWYCIFSAADQPFSSLHNPNITDGSAVMVIKDSYGNAFIPWLVDHYEYTYWVDFRYTDETVSHMAETYGVQDVIFEAATFNATGNLCNDLFLQIGS